MTKSSETKRTVQRSEYAPALTQSLLSLAVSNLLLSGLFVLMLWNAIPRNTLLTWLTVAAVLAGAELLAYLAQARRNWQLATRALDVSVGFLWLYAAIFFFPAAQPNLQFFFLFSLGAPALCTAVYQHTYLPSCFARIGLALPVAAVHLINRNDSLGDVQAFIVFALWASVMWLAVRLHRDLQERRQLTLNRDTLLRKISDNALDLDALRKKEAASRQMAESANLAKSRFLAHSSHDLRQPLHAISLLLETIEDESLDRSTGHVIDSVRRSVELLSNLFDSLLDLTLLDTGQVEICAIDFSVDEIFAEVAGDFASIAEANSVTLLVESCGHFVHADPTITRRMIQNLVANAIRHSAHGRVVIRSIRSGDALNIEVKDTGSGIAKEDQQRIFDEFTKLNKSVGTQSTGSLGLGLAIVSRLARLTDVNVCVESEPGRGSLFSIGPFAVCAPVDGPVATKFAPILDLKGLRIVVVDDDVETLKATGKLLHKWGLAVTLCENSDLDAIARPDILVCDYELGGQQTGIDIIHEVRKKYAATLPALLISGNTSAELAARASSEKLQLLHKPVRPAQLKSAILTLLGTEH